MTKAEQIIVRRIHEIENLMDMELDAQLEAEGNKDTTFDMEASDRRWTGLFDSKCELMSILAEIRGCTITDIVLE